MESDDIFQSESNPCCQNKPKQAKTKTTKNHLWRNILISRKVRLSLMPGSYILLFIKAILLNMILARCFPLQNLLSPDYSWNKEHVAQRFVFTVSVVKLQVFLRRIVCVLLAKESALHTTVYGWYHTHARTTLYKKPMEIAYIGDCLQPHGAIYLSLSCAWLDFEKNNHP